jgi:hypothetical protein
MSTKLILYALSSCVGLVFLYVERVHIVPIAVSTMRVVAGPGFGPGSERCTP